MSIRAVSAPHARWVLVATVLFGAGCRHIYVPEETGNESSSSTGGSTGCTELEWDLDEPVALDPLYGLQGKRAFVEGPDGVRLVSARLHPDFTSTIVTTHVADPWGASPSIATPVDRGVIPTGILEVVPRADGSALVFSVQQAINEHESVTWRVELPAGDGMVSNEQSLASTFAVLSFASGRAMTARIDMIEEGGAGWPWVQRLVFSDAETGLPLYEREGELFQPRRFESGVGRGAYLEIDESEDYETNNPALRTWLAVEEGLLEADLTEFWTFGRTATGSVGMTFDQEGEEPISEVVAISEDGAPGSVLFPLPSEIAKGPGTSRITPWKSEHAIVSQLSQEGEEEAELRVHARADDGTPLVSPPIPTRRQEDAVQFILGPDGESMLVAYEAWPASDGVRLARLVCR